jgi:hypothetical protein
MDAELAMDQEAAKGSRTRCVTLAWRLKIVASKDVSFFLKEHPKMIIVIVDGKTI